MLGAMGLVARKLPLHPATPEDLFALPEGERHHEIIDVRRWAPDGYIEVLAATRGERVQAEPFEAVELSVGALFGDEEPEE